MNIEKDIQHRAKIRRLNDRLRCHGIGQGSVLITSGIQDQGQEFGLNVIEAVRTFDEFTPDNDPHGEHDFGAFEVDGKRLFWKIDYYDTSFESGSNDPASEEQTHRVLTIMLASEY
jgi:hypothetical protein